MVSNSSGFGKDHLSDKDHRIYSGTFNGEDLEDFWEIGLEIGTHPEEYQDADLRFEYMANLQNGDEELTVEYTGGIFSPKTIYETDFEDKDCKWHDVEEKLKNSSSVQRERSLD